LMSGPRRFEICEASRGFVPETRNLESNRDAHRSVVLTTFQSTFKVKRSYPGNRLND
jgi:hypothetical protein